jgi:hypothetical protein
MVSETTLSSEYRTFLRAYLNSTHRKDVQRLSGVVAGYRRCLEMTGNDDAIMEAENAIEEEVMIAGGPLAHVQRTKSMQKLNAIRL